MTCPKRVVEAFRRRNTFWTILLPLRSKTLPLLPYSLIPLPCFLRLNRNLSPSSFSFTNREIERDDETDEREREIHGGEELPEVARFSSSKELTELGA